MIELNLKKLTNKKYVLIIKKDNEILHKYCRPLDICADISLSFFDVFKSELKLTGEWDK